MRIDFILSANLDDVQMPRIACDADSIGKVKQVLVEASIGFEQKGHILHLQAKEDYMPAVRACESALGIKLIS